MDIAQCRKHLESILKAEENAAQTIVAEAKESAKTYADVRNNLDKLIRDIRFVDKDWKHYGNALNMAKQLLDEEMDGLPMKQSVDCSERSD